MNPDTFKVWNSRKTVIEMLADRGYHIPDDIKLTLQEFSDMEEVDDIRVTKTGKSAVLKVSWPEDANISAIQKIANEAEEEEIKRVILVVNTSVTPQAKIAIRDLKILKVHIEIFTITELQANISKNILVPKHFICPISKRDKILKSYSVDPKQIPHIKKTDPMARYLGALVGNMIQIVRDSETMPGKKIVTFRIVVA